MPSIALRFCNEPGCSELQRATYCDMHAKQRTESLVRKVADPFYKTLLWMQIRERKLKKQRTCQHIVQLDRRVCGKLATDVDHIVSRANGGTNEESNLQSLCHRHHSMITCKYDGGFGHEKKAR